MELLSHKRADDYEEKTFAPTALFERLWKCDICFIYL